MNILFEKFPDSVRVSGKRYQIETDFREWIRFIALVEDDSIPWQHKVNLMGQWYTDDIPEDVEDAVYALGEFCAGTSDEEEDEPYQKKENAKQVFSFGQDASCIYSAFREVYGINLQDIPYMHWWEFQTLLTGLPESTEIKQRMMYRGIDIRDIKDKNERKRIKKIQDAIALKRKHRRKIDDYEIGAMFW